ncbi:Fet3 protein [Multifurca ochricompacta]|uniref:Fet3 protein n=1 Tax=Multifurca ochricompacta TaxID=376703 RepID=A0AAD4M9T7_9AGAM|nr:Fet3 protein [Multifurca ochricompacta]
MDKINMAFRYVVSSLRFLLTAASPTFAGVKEIWWNLTYVENANPDGSLNVVPPPIEVTTNDTLIVHALNTLSEPSTLHHHGMFFNYSTWFDGAQGVSQCGIPPGQSFDYVIPINTSGQWGTYWVHAHASGQYVDGLRAPLVIHPSKEVYSYDAEYTIILGDWYHKEHSVLLKRFISIANPGGAEPVPNSALIYFAQNGSYLGPNSGTSPASVTSHVGFNENATLPFEPGKTYRLRIVNTSAFAAFFFWIDGHEMRIIEVDGTDVEESPIDLLGITVAQRYSVLVTARNDTSSNWAIHANMDTAMFDKVPPALQPNITSSITYKSSAPLTNLGFVDAYHDVNDTALVPVVVEPMLPVDQTIELEAIFDTMDDGTNRALFNQVTYNSPLVPTVLSTLTLGVNATTATAYGTTSIVLDHLSAVEIILKNGDRGKHPFHLHGHKVQIVNRAEDYTSSDPTLNPPIVEGQANPMRRDTVQVPAGTSVTLRVVADNPGAWLFHCHIEWHLEAGLAVTFVEAPLQIQERAQSVQAPPAVLAQQCRMLNLPTSGNAAGHASATDLSGLPTGPFQQKNGWHTKGILAMTGCVLTAVLGMLTVAWYTMGGALSEEELEHEVRAAHAAKLKRGRLFGLVKRKQR